MLLWCLGVTGALVIIAFLVMPWVRRHLRRRRGLCVTCGYDLSTTGDASQRRCPECGAIPGYGAT
jgi:tRNA(Ile2) C34 agmatinyltransferase TiaS